MMKPALLVFIFLLLIGVTAAAEPVITITVHYDQGSVEIGSATIQRGYVPVVPEASGPYLVRVVNKTNDTVIATPFTIGTDGIVDGVGRQQLQDTEKRLVLPYDPHAERAILYVEGVEQSTTVITGHERVPDLVQETEPGAQRSTDEVLREIRRFLATYGYVLLGLGGVLLVVGFLLWRRHRDTGTQIDWEPEERPYERWRKRRRDAARDRRRQRRNERQ